MVVYFCKINNKIKNKIKLGVMQGRAIRCSGFMFDSEKEKGKSVQRNVRT
jgi:hypothetical protein